MARSFSSIGAFTAFMRGRLSTLPSAQKRALAKGAEIIREEAHAIPGHYQEGWKKLSPATLNGGVSPEGYHYKGKIELGYSAPDNPLLRDGGLRDSYKYKVVSPTAAAVGSNDDKALWQELGTRRGIPPRPVIKTACVKKGKEAAHLIADAVIAHIAGRTNR